MTSAVQAPPAAPSENEPAPRMWLKVYRLGPDGRRREILPRTDVDDMLDQDGLSISTELPPCQCPQHRRQT